MKFKAGAVIREMLAGVGVPETDILIDGNLCRTVRRMATDEERARVSENYLQCGEDKKE